LKCYSFFLLGLFFGVHLPIHAQVENKILLDSTRILKDVVVTATRKPSFLVSSPFSVSILQRKDVDNLMFRSTPDALMAVPGVFVQKTNHGGGSPFVRGLTGNQTLIIVDGIRLNNSTFRYGPNQYLNTIDAFTINRIEVVKGSGSVQYGSDAIGGVIQVLTQEPLYAEKQQFNGKITGRYWGANMEKTGRSQLMYSSPKFAVFGGVSGKDFGDIVGGDSTGRQSPSGYNEFDADIKLKWKIASRVEMIAAHQMVQQKNVPVYHKVQLENFMLNEMSPQNRNLSYLKLKIDYKNKFYESISLVGSFQQILEGRNSRKIGNNTLRSESDQVATANASVDVFSVPNKYWTLNTGLEYYKDHIGSTREDFNTVNQTSVTLRGLYPNGATYSSASLYHLHHLEIKKFNFEGGVRFNQFQIAVKDESLGLVKINPSAVVVNAGVNYAIGIHHLYSSFSSGYRAPNIDDMGTLGIVDFRYEIPSYHLKPEKSYHTEIGYKVQGSQWKASVAIFNNRLSNLITRVKLEGQVIDGYAVYKKENIEKASINGGEASVQWVINKRILLNSFVAYVYGKNRTKSEPLRRMPPFNGNTSIKYSVKKFYVMTELAWAAKQTRLAQGDKEDNRIPAGGTPGWMVLNVFAGYQFNPLQFKISGQNLWNEDYRTHGSGINGVGRSLLMSCSYSF
jgi:outer membrane cobalamin receptor